MFNTTSKDFSFFNKTTYKMSCAYDKGFSNKVFLMVLQIHDKISWNWETWFLRTINVVPWPTFMKKLTSFPWSKFDSYGLFSPKWLSVYDNPMWWTWSKSFRLDGTSKFERCSNVFMTSSLLFFSLTSAPWICKQLLLLYCSLSLHFTSYWSIVFSGIDMMDSNFPILPFCSENFSSRFIE